MSARKYVDPTAFDMTERVFTIEEIDAFFYFRMGGLCLEDQAFMDSLLSGHVQFIAADASWSAVVDIPGPTDAHGIPLERFPEVTVGCSYRIIFLSCEINADYFDLIVGTELHTRDLK